MVVALLNLIIQILLFGAGVVHGWLLNIFGAILGILLLATAIAVVSHFFGEDAFIWIWAGGGTILLITVLWARQYDPSEAEHRVRMKRAKRERDELRRQSEAEKKVRLQQTPIESLMSVFEEYDARTIPTTKDKANEFYEAQDEKELRELVSKICERNQDCLQFDGSHYTRRRKYGN